MEAVLVNFVLAVWGWFVSWAEERWGSFNDFTPSQKQWVNSFLAWVVPVVATSGLFYWWTPELGNLTEVLTAVGIFVAPFVSWLISQVAHFVDKKLAS